MNSTVIWHERRLLANSRSLGSTAVLGLIPAVLTFLDTPGKGGFFGAMVVSVLLAYLLATMFLCEVKVSKTHITIGVFPYRKVVDLRTVMKTEAKLLEAGEPPRIRWRRNGIGLPGMQLGWFSTSGRRPVFAATAGRSQRILIPTHGKYDLMITSRSSEALLELIRSLP